MARTFHPRGQATLGGSVIVNADNFKLDTTNSLGLKGTLADPNGIPVDGMRSATVTMDLYLTNDQAASQAEFAAITAVLNGTSAEPIQIGYKNGNISALVSCTPSQVSLSDKLGEAAMFSLTAMGKVIDSQGC